MVPGFSLLPGPPLVVLPAALAFCVGGIVNGIGGAKIRASFIQLGFPGWWCLVTGASEIVTAALLLAPGTRRAGIVLGLCIMAAAVVAVMRSGRHRHLLPPLLFVLLLAFATI